MTLPQEPAPTRRRPTAIYRFVMRVVAPIVRWWGRLEVVGLEHLPPDGRCLLIANHDSHWDPLVVGVAAMHRRPVQALAKSSLWNSRAGAALLNGMGQYPITRGTVVRSELADVVHGLRSGDCVGIFPEGTISRGEYLRAYSGAGWFAGAVPGTRVVAVAISGAVDVVRFPKRPRIRVEFFLPTPAHRTDTESSVGFSRRVLDEIRAIAPPAHAGRGRRTPAPVEAARKKQWTTSGSAVLVPAYAEVSADQRS